MNKNTTNTRDKILATAEELIYQNGIHATGMDLLVKTSGVARKVFITISQTRTKWLPQR
jgi:AcrR family transcriptional regulator